MFKSVVTIIIFAAIVSAIPQDNLEKFVQMPGFAITNFNSSIMITLSSTSSIGYCADALEVYEQNLASWNEEKTECVVMKTNANVGGAVQYRKDGSQVSAPYSLDLYAMSSPNNPTVDKMKEYLQVYDIVSVENGKLYFVSFTKDLNSLILFRGIQTVKPQV